MATGLLAATKVHVTTNSFGTYDFYGKHFYIIPGSPSINPKDAEFKEYANHVASMFRSSGAIEVSDPALAEVCVLVDYLVTTESYVEQIPVPIRKVVGSVTTAQIAADEAQGRTRHGNHYTTGDYAAVVTHRDIYETVGYQTEERQVDGYRRILNIYAYDNVDSDGDPDMLWKCNMMSFGSRNSLNSILPVMTYLNLFTPGKRVVEGKNWVDIDYGWSCYEAYTKTMKDYAHAWFPYRKVEDKTWTYFMTRNHNEMTITIRQKGPGKRNVTMDTYLLANGVQYPVVAVDHIKAGKNVRIKEDENLYFTLTFLDVPEDVEVFDIICPGKFTWQNIAIH